MNTGPPAPHSSATALKIYSASVHGEYPVYLGPGAVEQLMEEVETRDPDRIFIIMDRTVETLLTETIRENLPYTLPIEPIVFNEGEENKNLATLQHIAGDLLRGGVTDRSLILNVGGGVTLNLGGLAASLLRHGVRFAQVATTTTAQWQVVGSNLQAVHFVGARNGLGVYRSPEFAVADTDLLESEPERQARASLAELARLGLVLGGTAFAKVEATLSESDAHRHPRLAETVREAFEIRREAAGEDPGEHVLPRAELYGTTAGRALEALAEGRLLPAEATYYGMRIAGALAFMLGRMSKEELGRHQDLLDRTAPDAEIPKSIRADRLVSLLHGNNKTLVDGISFMLLERIGKVAGAEGDDPYAARVGVTDDAVHEAFKRISSDAVL